MIIVRMATSTCEDQLGNSCGSCAAGSDHGTTIRRRLKNEGLYLSGFLTAICGAWLLASPSIASAQLSGRTPQLVDRRAATADQKARLPAWFDQALERLRSAPNRDRTVNQTLLDSVTRSLQMSQSPPVAGSTAVDGTFVDMLLARFQPDPAKRKPVIDALVAVLTASPINQPFVASLVEQAGVEPPYIEVAATVLSAAGSGAAGPAIQKAKTVADYLLTAAATSIAQDRALVTSTVVEFPFTRGALRFITTAAVSNADSATTSGQTSVSYRTRTADLLTIMQTGGNGVLRLFADLSKDPDKAGGLHASVILDGGVMGSWLNANTASRFMAGGVIEATWLKESAYSPSLPEPVALFLSVRAGGRWADKGIVTDDANHKVLGFVQGLLEFRLPGGKIPLGISVNFVNHDLKGYALPFHIYTNVGR
jgi:hypothetical protein